MADIESNDVLKNFTDIVDETKAVVLSAIHKFLYREHTDSIDDVVQETYLKAYRALKKNQFRSEAKLSTWLYQIAKNEAIKMNQKLGRETTKKKKLTMRGQESERLQRINGLNQPVFSSEASVEGEFLKQEEGEVLKKAIVDLPGKYLEIIELYLKGRNMNEMGKLLSIPAGTVKSRLFRAKEFLRKSVKVGRPMFNLKGQ